MATAALQQLEVADDRALTRHRLMTGASIAGASVAGAPVSLCNLSLTGVLIESELALPAGAPLTLDIPNVGKVEATVAWTSGDLHGAQFTTPLSQAALADALGASKVVWPAFTPSVPTGPWDRAASVVEADAPVVAAETPAIIEAMIPPATDFAESRSGLPIPVRAQVIVGVSALLWVAIGRLVSLMLG